MYNILNWFKSTVWAIEPSKLEAMIAFLDARIKGEPIAQLVKPTFDQTTGLTYYGRIPSLNVFGTIARRGSLLSESSGGASLVRIEQRFDEAMSDPRSDTVLMVFDSPGGEISGVPEFADKVYNARSKKRIIAAVDTMAASAAYWIASQANEIVATPSGSVGSIGVLAMHEDRSKQYEEHGINVTVIKSTEYKGEWLDVAPPSEDYIEHMQAIVDMWHSRFVQAVARGRNADVKDVDDKWGKGRMFYAADALELGMVDRIESFTDTVSRLVRVSDAMARNEAIRNSGV